MRRPLVLASLLVPGILLVLLFNANRLSASDNYTVAYGTSESITSFETCAKVTNNSATNASVYVPTQTAVEWQSFRDHPPAGVTVGPCCDGVMVGGYCWYAGATGQSCNTVCSAHGGCNLAGTKNYIGSGGTVAQCKVVGNALGFSGNVWNITNGHGAYYAYGCTYVPANKEITRLAVEATTCGAAQSAYRRICACNN